MEKLVFLFFFVVAEAGFGTEYRAEVVKTWELPADFKLNKRKIGGLSGCSVLNDRIYLVSDDRGGQGGPRIISFGYNRAQNEIDFTDNEIIRVKPVGKQKILDLEGIGSLSKDMFLLSSEGDLNQKPRVMPEIFWVDSRGQRQSSIDFPKDFLPEKSGKQTQGIQLNQGFEGLVVDLDLKKWAALLEAPLVQDQKILRLIESDLQSTHFDRIYTYPQPTDLDASSLSGYFGVTAMLFLNDTSYLILERGVEASLQGISYRSQLCAATKTGQLALGRRCFYSMNTDPKVTAKYPAGANFEGLCWVNKQKKLFLTVSDNNFSKNEKSVFILYQLN